ncbi:GNAT family N-acetyltransferase [uncultured Amnibacterium sp.]|uniref:GNAT family N-acetyltransferase n=1 Tax=uncultured Amnibacterium sp. TaxID=1631851 RepID=UPI0035CAC255
MIRSATDADREEIVALVVDAGMFPPEESAVVDDLLRAGLADAGDDHRCLVVERAGRLAAVAYAAIRPAADRVWELTMLGVRPGEQRSGDGTALTGAIEQELAARGQRLLVVETSAGPQYAGARSFYAARGYDEEARIRDYWADGDDLVVLTKRLVAPEAGSGR